MKTSNCRPLRRDWLRLLLFCCGAFSASFTSFIGFAGDVITLQPPNTNAPNAVQWRGQMKKPISGMYSRYRVETSGDLKEWTDAGIYVDGKIGAADETIRKQGASPSGARAFYRVMATNSIAEGAKFPDAVYGYSTVFNQEIADIGQITPDQFAQRYGVTNEYLASLSFDPTTSLFWPEFNTDPGVFNATNKTDPRLTDFRLTPEEFAIFKTNGFVVTPRLGSYSFADVFYNVFTDDLPVFVSTDALLQAWHRTYIAILEEIEEAFLAPRLRTMITEMQTQVDVLYAEARNTPLEAGVLDADFFLAVTRSMQINGMDYGRCNQGPRIAAALDNINNLQVVEGPLYGKDRIVDYSQMKVRGHYEKTVQLQRYFRAMMWASLADFRFTGSKTDNSLREFSGAVAMNILLDRAGQRDAWMAYDQTIRMFVGPADCLTFAQLGDLLSAANFAAPYTQLTNLYAQISSGDLGVQQIRSGYFFSPLGPEKLQLPRSFAFAPQRFLLDSWAQSKIVYDEILWDDAKVIRRVPSALDVAFTTLGNSQVVPELVARIQDTHGVPFRDGYYYQHNLAAVRNVIDAQAASTWTNNIYNAWLGCLRTLSEPTTSQVYPEAMRTRAWALHTANTQLASWTELRHDTVLYGKQPYTAVMSCGYPKGFVEPRPAFWNALGAMAANAKQLIETLPPEGFLTISNGLTGSVTYNMDQLKTNWTAVFDRFGQASVTLKSISEKELARQDLSQAEIDFLKNIVERYWDYFSGQRAYRGWYPNLFYKPLAHVTAFGADEGADMWDALVTDVHSDTPSPDAGDPGSVLHEAVGNVHMAFMAVDCGEDQPIMYAGPVLSHYEFQLGPTTRLADSEWKTQLKAGTLPPSPSWTKSFLAPGAYAVPWFIN